MIKMKMRTLITAPAVVLLAMALSSSAADKTRFNAKPGKDMRVRIEGTSTVHDWQVEGPIIAGNLTVGEGFPTEPGMAAKPGKLDAAVDFRIPVNSLKSIEKDGRPYSDRMDEVMQEKLKSPPNRNITFHLTGLELKETAKTKDDPYLCEAKGELAVAGTTNKITFPVSILPLAGKRIKVSGKTSISMKDYKVEAPVLVGILSTGDKVTLSFEWPVMQAAAPKAVEAAAPK